MTEIRHCAMCGVRDGERGRVLLFYLGYRTGGRHNTRPAGSLHLCPSCWQRHCRGERTRNRPYTPMFHLRRLTAAQVREIRARPGVVAEFAQRFGVSTVTITNVHRGRFYREVAA